MLHFVNELITGFLIGSGAIAWGLIAHGAIRRWQDRHHKETGVPLSGKTRQAELLRDIERCEFAIDRLESRWRYLIDNNYFEMANDIERRLDIFRADLKKLQAQRVVEQETEPEAWL